MAHLLLVTQDGVGHPATEPALEEDELLDPENFASRSLCPSSSSETSYAFSPSGDAPESSAIHPVIITCPPGLASAGGRELRGKAGLLVKGWGQGPKLMKRNQWGHM